MRFYQQKGYWYTSIYLRSNIYESNDLLARDISFLIRRQLLL